MGLLDFLKKKKGAQLGLAELARRLGMSEPELAAAEVRDHEFAVPVGATDGDLLTVNDDHLVQDCPASLRLRRVADVGRIVAFQPLEE